MATWDIARLRQLAGQPLNESYDDDDDDGMSASERALASKADGDLKKKGIKVAKVDPDKDLHALAQRRKAKEAKKEADADEEEKKAAATSKAEKEAEEKNAPKAAESDDEDDKKEEKKPAPKADEKKDEPKAEEKKEEAAAEAKRRGKKPDANSKSQRALAWIKANPDAGGGAFAKWAIANIDMGKNYANTYFHGLKAKARAQLKASANECFMISHPTLSTYFLHENRAMNQMQWVDSDSDNAPMVFESKDAAEKVIKYMAEWKSQQGNLVRVDLKD